MDRLCFLLPDVIPDRTGEWTVNEINKLKQVAETATSAYDAEKARLTAAGFKSQERYTMLKDLRAVADKAHAEYSKFAKGQIARELDKIIAAQTPAQRAEGLRLARGI